MVENVKIKMHVCTRCRVSKDIGAGANLGALLVQLVCV